MSTLPAATSNLLGFARLLRKSGFIIAPEQIMSFMQSVSLLGPRSIEDIRRAASAALAPLPERMQEFDALFRTWFWGEGIELGGTRLTPTTAAPGESVSVYIRWPLDAPPGPADLHLLFHLDDRCAPPLLQSDVPGIGGE